MRLFRWTERVNKVESPKEKQPLNTAVGAFSYLLILLPAALAFLYVRVFGVNVPFWDQWHIVGQFDGLFAGTLGLPDLVGQHNEHRIVFPMIAMLLVGVVTRYNTVAEMYLTQSCIVVVLVVLFLAFRRSVKQGPLLFVPISFLLFNFRQHENMLWGFQLGFILPAVFSVLAFYFVYISADGNTGNSRRFGFSAALLSATVATFSSVQGLFVWPTGLLQIAISPMQTSAKRVMLGIWGFMGTLEWIIYFIDYEKPAHHPPLSSVLAHPVVGAEFFLSGLGSSLFWQPNFALVGGFLIACLVFAGVLSIYRATKLGELSFWLALILFSFLFLASITVGRSGFGVEQAMTSRYASFSVLAVIGLYATFVKLAFETRSRASMALLGALSGLILVSVPNSYQEGVKAGEETKASREKLAFILSTYQSQPEELLQELNPMPGLIREYAPVLERAGYSVFSKAQAQASLPPISSLSPAPSSTAFHLDTINNVEASQHKQPIVLPGKDRFIIVRGWAVDADAKDLAGGVYVKIDGKLFPAFYGISREDVAQALGDPTYSNSGFERAIPISSIGSGVHKLSIIVVTSDKEGYYEPQRSVIFGVDGG
jgi:hypothetical protein